MKIKKILNNNVIIIDDKGQEIIAVGPGIGFNKKKNDIVIQKKIEKLFVLKENEKFEQLLMRIPEEHFTLSEQIIAYAEQQLGTKLNNHIHLALTDHLSFAIERLEQGIHLKNKLLSEIKVLYKKEFEIGQWAVQHMKEQLGIDVPIDEAAFIALHIHTMKVQGGDLRETVKQTAIVRDMVKSIENRLCIKVVKQDLSYERLVTHLLFALDRISHYDAHVLDHEMLDMIKRKFAISYDCAKKVAEELANNNGIKMPEEELGYITLHIERLREK